MINKIRFIFFNIFYAFAVLSIVMMKFQNKGFYFGILFITLISVIFVSLHIQNKDNLKTIDELNMQYNIINNLYNLKVTKFKIKDEFKVEFDGESYTFDEKYEKETNILIYNALNDIVENMYILSLGHEDCCDAFFVPMVSKNIAEKICFVDTMLKCTDKLYYLQDYDTMEITMWILNILDYESNGLKLGLNFLENENKYELVLFKV